MTAPRPVRDSAGRMLVKQHDSGRVIYQADDGTGWWAIEALPHVGRDELLYQMESVWRQPGQNSAKQQVRESMPILAAFLDLLSAPQNLIAEPARVQVRPRQSGKSQESALMHRVLTVPCSVCGADVGVVCTVPGYTDARIHVPRYIDAGLGSPETPSLKESP